MANETTELLRRVELLGGLSDKELAAVAATMRERSFPPGEEVTIQDTPGGRFHLIVEGTADVVVDGQRRASLGPGQYFGEMSLLDDEPRSATVVAATPLRTFSVAPWNFRSLLREHPSIAEKLLVGLSRRLRAAERHLA